MLKPAKRAQGNQTPQLFAYRTHGEGVFTPGSCIAKAYNRLNADEGFGVNPDF
ncbi:hypothetical protein [Sodalis ligni]|uniref:hypothetical protein n=1 Tax=Sodalis ligni TaxID=2697027 RepID=UPI0014045A9A|nr:hypothetical protein [Sodalis ligni]